MKHHKMTRNPKLESCCCRKCIRNLIERYGFKPVLISAILLGLLLIVIIIIVRIYLKI